MAEPMNSKCCNMYVNILSRRFDKVCFCAIDINYIRNYLDLGKCTIGGCGDIDRDRWMHGLLGLG
jgi:hypothetical protein